MYIAQFLRYQVPKLAGSKGDFIGTA